MTAITESQLFHDWHDWPIGKKPVLVEEFSRGLNHHSFLIQSGSDLYVLKYLSTPKSSAIKAQQKAYQLDIAPKVLYVRNDQRLFLMDYIPDSQQYPTSNIFSLADSLRKLHGAGTLSSSSNFDLLATCKHYLTSCNSDIRAIHTKLEPALTVFLNDPTPWCFCHNDLVSDNCLNNQNSTVLIDWEFAQNNNPWFDLASVIIYQGFNASDTTRLFNAYDNRFLQSIDTPIFLASKISVLWLDILWHLFKFGQDYYPELKQKMTLLNGIAQKLDIDIS